MDAFYASVEQKDNPSLRGRPVVVGGRPDSRGVVAAASYEAREYGIHSAMPCSQAYRLCPQTIFVRPRFEAYKKISQQIRQIFLEFTDIIEPLSLDEAYLDVTENKLNQASATLIAEEVRKRIFEKTGLTASAGVSYNKFLAKTASDINKPNGIKVILPEEGEDFVATLPIGKFYGIGKATEQRMHTLGIINGADLKTKPLAFLVEKFGKSAEYFYKIARGVDDREVKVSTKRKSLGNESTFSKDIDDLDKLLEKLSSQTKSLSNVLAKRDLQGKTISIKVKFDNFQQITRSKTLNHATADFEQIFSIAKALLLNTDAGKRKVRLLGISMASFGDEQVQQAVQLELDLKMG